MTADLIDLKPDSEFWAVLDGARTHCALIGGKFFSDGLSAGGPLQAARVYDDADEVTLTVVGACAVGRPRARYVDVLWGAGAGARLRSQRPAAPAPGPSPAAPEEPSRAQVREVVALACRRELASPSDVLGGHVAPDPGRPQHLAARVSRARVYAAMALAALNPDCPDARVAELVGVLKKSSRGHYLSHHRLCVRRGIHRWWSDEFFVTLTELGERVP